MPDSRGWPDPTNPHQPLAPDQEGPHLIADEYGRPCWAWWTPDSDKLGDCWKSAGGDGWRQEWHYIGPAVEPTNG